MSASRLKTEDRKNAKRQREQIFVNVAVSILRSKQYTDDGIISPVQFGPVQNCSINANLIEMKKVWPHSVLLFNRSNQINCINMAQNHNHIASVGFKNCTVKDTLCPQTLESSEEKIVPI